MSPARKSGWFELDDLAGAQRAHHLADPNRRRVGATGIHPAAHGGVERDEEHANQKLAIGGGRNWLGAELPVGENRQSVRTRREAPLTVGGDVIGHAHIRARAGGC